MSQAHWSMQSYVLNLKHLYFVIWTYNMLLKYVSVMPVFLIGMLYGRIMDSYRVSQKNRD